MIKIERISNGYLITEYIEGYTDSDGWKEQPTQHRSAIHTTEELLNFVYSHFADDDYIKHKVKIVDEDSEDKYEKWKNREVQLGEDIKKVIAEDTKEGADKFEESLKQLKKDREKSFKVFDENTYKHLEANATLKDIVKFTGTPLSAYHKEEGENITQSTITPKRTVAFPGLGDTIKKIKPNKAKCLLCNETIESKYRHDYVTCKCGNLSVDGGLDYQKRNFEKPNSYVEVYE